MNPTLALALCPVVTGLASVLWSKLLSVHPAWAMVANVVAYGANTMFLISIRDAAPAFRPLSYSEVFIFLGVVATASATSFLWLYALQESSLAAVSFVEIGYPLFILLFSYLLIGGVQLNAYHIAGGIVIAIGTSLVVVGNLYQKALGK